MKKVYLAKSNRANPNLVSRVRQTLSNFDVEIVEYTGGTFSHDELLGCDELIVIPDVSTGETDMYDEFHQIDIGKGLYEQMDSFRDRHDDGFFIVTDFDGSEGIGGYFYDTGINHRKNEEDECEIAIKDSRDFIKYGYISFNLSRTGYAEWEFNDYVKESFEEKTVQSILNSIENKKVVTSGTYGSFNDEFLLLLIK